MYSTQEICKLSGVTRRALGIYVKKGLITPPNKQGKGENIQYNYYSEETLNRLIIIKFLSDMKIPLSDIKEYLEKGDMDEKVTYQIAVLNDRKNEITKIIDELTVFKLNGMQIGDDNENNKQINISELHKYVDTECKSFAERISNLICTNERENSKVSDNIYNAIKQTIKK